MGQPTKLPADGSRPGKLGGLMGVVGLGRSQCRAVPSVLRKSQQNSKLTALAGEGCAVARSKRYIQVIWSILGYRFR